MNNEILERIGQPVDKCENFMMGFKPPMNSLPPHITLESQKHGIKEIRDELKSIYFAAGGDKETWDFEVSYED